MSLIATVTLPDGAPAAVHTDGLGWTALTLDEQAAQRGTEGTR